MTILPLSDVWDFVAYSDSTVDKVNFVIFVITPKLLEPKIDEAAANVVAVLDPNKGGAAEWTGRKAEEVSNDLVKLGGTQEQLMNVVQISKIVSIGKKCG